jgi:hypothetical protein
VALILVAIVNGFFWALILRGPYWLYKKFKGEQPDHFWWPWGFVSGAIFALLTLALYAAA